MGRNNQQRLSYFEYWKKRGEYGEIRIKRMLARKDARYHKHSKNGNGYCTHSKNSWHSCPFQEDMNNNDDPHYCRCCSECRNECAMDI